ncbi:tripartite tricarboxylate transporter substrate binding protein [Pigmentiphaga soli]|uniref:Tripartite tricarboxylate transporter substrate binding protein n=1 Tax=Pigmentiphaga soli TaxID=1007095 RepID=A0ABP8HNS2_9BURK
MKNRHNWPRLGALPALALALPIAAPAMAEESFPRAPIQLIAPFAAGGGFDSVGRVISDQLSKILGVSVVVLNKPGAGGLVGGAYVAKARPDGYTLLLAGPATLAIGPNLFSNASYSPTTSFEPITYIGGTAYFLAARPDVAKDVKTLIAKAKAAPGKLAYASPGTGSNLNLSMELFKLKTGTDIMHVPYPGSGPAIVDVLAGRVQMTLAPEIVLPHIRSGQLAGLAVSTSARSPLMPDIPTFAEAGVQGVESSGWYGVLAPGGTPKPVIDKLNAAVNQMLQSQPFKEQADKLGLEIGGGTPEQLGQRIDEENRKWKTVIDVAGIKAQ